MCIQTTLCWLLWTASAAVAPATQAAGMDPAEQEILVSEAIDLFSRGELAPAEADLRGVLRANPDNTEARYYLALILLRRGKSAEALAELDLAGRAAPELSQPSIERGLALLGAGKEKQAVETLQKVVDASPDNGLARLMLGVAQFRAGRLADARLNLTRAKERDADLGGYADAYLGLIAAREGDTAKARKLLSSSATLAPTSELGQRAFTLVEQLEKEEIKPRRWDAELRLGQSYDSNVILLGENTPLPRAHIGRPGFIGQKHDLRTGLNFDLEVRPIETDRFRLSLGGSTFDSWHCHINEFNLQSYAGHAQGDFLLSDRTRAGLRYDYEYSLLGNQPLLSSNELTPQLAHAWTDWTSTIVFYQYGHGNYLREVPDWRLDLDYDRQSVGLIEPFATRVLGRPVTFNVGYRFDNESTAGVDFDRMAHALSAGVAASLPWKLTFEFSSEWRWEDYKRPSTVDFLRHPRQDLVQTYVFALTRPITKNLSVRGEIDLILDDSNVATRAHEEIYSYDRAIYGITFIYKF